MSDAKRQQSRSLGELRMLVPVSMRPSSSSDWPDSIEVSRITRRECLARSAQRIDLSDPQVAQSVLAAIGTRRDLLAPISTNITLDTSSRIALAGDKSFWLLKLAAELPDVPDANVISALAGSIVHFSQLEDVLVARPHLAGSWSSWSDKNRRALLASVFCPEDLGRFMLDSAKLNSSSRAREIWDSISSSPVLPAGLREEALMRRAGRWEGERLLVARYAMETIPTLAWPWTDQQLEELPAAHMVGLVSWASQCWSPHIETGPSHEYGSTMVVKRLERTYAGRAAITLLGMDLSSDWVFPDERLYRRIEPDFIAATGSVVAATTAAHVWERPVHLNRLERFRVRMESTDDLLTKAVVAQDFLGADKGAWENLLGLHANWAGTFGEMLMAAKALA